VSARIRVCSRFKLFLCSVLIDVRCFHVPHKMSTPTPGVYAYPRLKTIALEVQGKKVFVIMLNQLSTAT
jgi:hypothetical protein